MSIQTKKQNFHPKIENFHPKIKKFYLKIKIFIQKFHPESFDSKHGKKSFSYRENP